MNNSGPASHAGAGHRHGGSPPVAGAGVDPRGVRAGLRGLPEGRRGDGGGRDGFGDPRCAQRHRVCRAARAPPADAGAALGVRGPAGRAAGQRARAAGRVKGLVERFDIEPFPDFSAK